MTTRMTSTHFTSTIAWRFTTLTSTSTECTHGRIVSPSLIIHTHIGSSSSLVRTPLTTIIMAIHVVVVSSTWLPPFTSSPSSCLSWAASGAQPEDHGKPEQLRYQRGWGHLRRPLPHHNNWSSFFPVAVFFTLLHPRKHVIWGVVLTACST